MQSHILFSFITRVKIVTFSVLLLPALLFSGCGMKKREAFTETIYSQNGSSRNSSGTSPEEEDGISGDLQDSGRSAGGTENTEDSARRQICVFVCGAVMNEGVYYLDEGSRVIDAVNAAGGFREDADRSYVNQAEYVYDAERVSIPTAGEAEELRTDAGAERETPLQGAGQTGNGLININTASRTELMEIPGIGESKADRIISYRENHGRFGSVDEIRNVSGIGSGIYEGLKDYITVD